MNGSESKLDKKKFLGPGILGLGLSKQMYVNVNQTGSRLGQDLNLNVILNVFLNVFLNVILNVILNVNLNVILNVNLNIILTFNGTWFEVIQLWFEVI